MAWNYRIVKTKVNGTARYAIHEAYYGRDGGRSMAGLSVEEMDALGVGWTENPSSIETTVEGDEVDDPEEQRKHLKHMLKQMMFACEKPIIDEEKIEGAEYEKAT
jgi:hypothetical protein